MHYSFSYAFLSLLISTPLHAKTIDWIVTDFAPYYIFNDRYAGTGRDEGVIGLLEQQLPDYTFTRTIFPSSRTIPELSKPNHTYCMLSLYKSPDREQHISFSGQTSTVGLSPSIAIHKELVQHLKLNTNAPVSLKTLLNKYQLTLGISMNRSYGKTIDKVINNSADASIIIRPGQDTLASLTYMLKKKRIDVLLGYPSEHYYLAKSMGFEDELVQLPLTEASDLSYGYIGCTNTELGISQVEALNAALKKIKQQPAYHEVLLRWLPNNLKPLLEQRLKANKNASTE
ncbi:TIGR02285 family protein [Pseudoalteromonas ostreae]|uniref:TIGR02285 family protein n=1 Tax=Pseudoalteromonas ostreae TaxID=2774154 RepID=UPI001B378AD4|nr:TIGR02285 family protein [Pseudoalteromonas ostreae]